MFHFIHLITTPKKPKKGERIVNVIVGMNTYDVSAECTGNDSLVRLGLDQMGY